MMEGDKSRTSDDSFQDHDENPEERQQRDSDTPLLPSSSPILSFTPEKSPQILAALVVTIGAFSLGNVLGWSSPGLPSLVAGGQLGEVSDNMKSWIGAIVNLGALISGLFVGIGMDKFGRKLTLLLISVPFVVGWVIIACSQNFGMMLAGRFITGFCGSAFTLVPPVYISEIAEPSIRGILSSAVILVLVSGILFTYILGSFVSWITLSLVCASIPLIFVCCMVFVPESPTYLLSKGRHEDAEKSLRWFRGASRISQIEPEFVQIQESIEGYSGRSTTWGFFFTSPILKPTCICLMLMFFQQLGGINAVIFYSKDIFDSTGGSVDSNLASIAVGSTQVIMCGISTFLVERAGRKILLVISDAGMAVSLMALAVFFHLKDQNAGKTPEGLAWLPLVSLIAYMITYNIALGSIPWVMMGEIIPPQVKGFTSALASSFCWTIGFIVVKNFPVLTGWVGAFTIFLAFAIISAIGSLYALFIVPETRGKSLDEIQALFRSR